MNLLVVVVVLGLLVSTTDGFAALGTNPMSGKPFSCPDAFKVQGFNAAKPAYVTPNGGANAATYDACTPMPTLEGYTLLWSLKAASSSSSKDGSNGGDVVWHGVLHASRSNLWAGLGLPQVPGQMIGASAVVVKPCVKCETGAEVGTYFLQGYQPSEVKQPGQLQLLSSAAELRQSGDGMQPVLLGEFELALPYPMENLTRQAVEIIYAQGPLASDGGLAGHAPGQNVQARIMLAGPQVGLLDLPTGDKWQPGREKGKEALLAAQAALLHAPADAAPSPSSSAAQPMSSAKQRVQEDSTAQRQEPLGAPQAAMAGAPQPSPKEDPEPKDEPKPKATSAPGPSPQPKPQSTAPAPGEQPKASPADTKSEKQSAAQSPAVQPSPAEAGGKALAPAPKPATEEPTNAPVVAVQDDVDQYVSEYSGGACSWDNGGKTRSFEHCNSVAKMDGAYLLRWNLEQPDGDRVLAVTLQARAPGWAAFGIAKEPGEMVGGSAVIVRTCDDCKTGASVDTYTLHSMTVKGVRPPGWIAADPKQMTAAAADGVLTTSFSITLGPATGEGAKYTGGDVPLLMATGRLSSDGRLQNHRPTRTALWLHLDDGDISEEGSLVGSGAGGGALALVTGRAWIWVHAGLMAGAWGVLLPAGALLARYGKGFGFWFKAHRTIQVTAYVVSMVGLVIGLKLHDLVGGDLAAAVGGGRSHDETPAAPAAAPADAGGRRLLHSGHEEVGSTAWELMEYHRQIGIAVTVLVSLQVTALFLRPAKGSAWRSVWHWAHWFCGWGALLLAAANIYLGIELLDLELRVVLAYSGVLAAQGAVIVIGEARRCMAGPTAAGYDLTHFDSMELGNLSDDEDALPTSAGAALNGGLEMTASRLRPAAPSPGGGTGLAGLTSIVSASDAATNGGARSQRGAPVEWQPLDDDGWDDEEIVVHAAKPNGSTAGSTRNGVGAAAGKPPLPPSEKGWKD